MVSVWDEYPYTERPLYVMTAVSDMMSDSTSFFYDVKV